MGEHGASFSGESIYDDTDEGKGVVRIAVGRRARRVPVRLRQRRHQRRQSRRSSRSSTPTRAELGFAVASALLGAAAGALIAGRIADHIGRLMVMRIAAILFFIARSAPGFARNLWVLVVFRIVGGLGVGIASVIAPAYIAEIAPAKLRGRLGSLQQLAIVTGIFISLLVDYIFATVGRQLRARTSGSAWRPGGGCSSRWSIPAVIYGLLALTIPESPRYLIAKHRIPEAKEILTGLLGPANIDAKVEPHPASRWSGSRSRPGRT